jgi:hypothetical protein
MQFHGSHFHKFLSFTENYGLDVEKRFGCTIIRRPMLAGAYGPGSASNDIYVKK